MTRRASLGHPGRRPAAERFGGDRGSVTAELAAALPVVILLLLTGLTGIDALMVKLRCLDAAAAAARAEARGEPGAVAGERVAPPGATVTVTRYGETVRATVRADARPLGARLPGFTLEATAVAASES